MAILAVFLLTEAGHKIKTSSPKVELQINLQNMNLLEFIIERARDHYSPPLIAMHQIGPVEPIHIVSRRTERDSRPDARCNIPSMYSTSRPSTST